MAELYRLLVLPTDYYYGYTFHVVATLGDAELTGSIALEANFNADLWRPDSGGWRYFYFSGTYGDAFIHRLNGYSEYWPYRYGNYAMSDHVPAGSFSLPDLGWIVNYDSGESSYANLEASGTLVPEPASLLLLGTGLVGLRAWRKRRQ